MILKWSHVDTTLAASGSGLPGRGPGMFSFPVQVPLCAHRYKKQEID
jgi:hypothetical protein